MRKPGDGSNQRWGAVGPSSRISDLFAVVAQLSGDRILACPSGPILAGSKPSYRGGAVAPRELRAEGERRQVLEVTEVRGHS
jgi:hypothetical protein